MGLGSADVPQSNDLGDLRAVTRARADGVEGPAAIAEVTGITVRHVGYALHSARALGLIDAHGAATDRGRALLATGEGSAAEREHLRRAVLESPTLRALAPDLLHATGPTLDVLAARITAQVPALSAATARRRAQALFAWRARLL